MSEFNCTSVDKFKIDLTAANSTVNTQPKQKSKPTAFNMYSLVNGPNLSSSDPLPRNLPPKKASSISNWLKIGALSAEEAQSVREMEGSNSNAATVTTIETNEQPPERGSLLTQVHFVIPV